MSGGSFNYLHFHAENEGIVQRIDDYKDMLNALREYPGSETAVADLTTALDHIQKAQDLILALSDVMYAVEWHHSADWGPERVTEALAKYRQR